MIHIIPHVRRVFAAALAVGLITGAGLAFALTVIEILG